MPTLVMMGIPASLQFFTGEFAHKVFLRGSTATAVHSTVVSASVASHPTEKKPPVYCGKYVKRSTSISATEVREYAPHWSMESLVDFGELSGE